MLALKQAQIDLKKIQNTGKKSVGNGEAGGKNEAQQNTKLKPKCLCYT